MVIQDKVIVVTGAASGIGKALAMRFKAEGAKLIVSVDLDEVGAKVTADEVGGIAMRADVGVKADVADVIER